MAYIALASMLVVYFSTWEQSTIAIYPGFLLVVGVVMGIALRSRFQVDEDIDEAEGRSIAYWTFIALIGVGLAGVVSSFTLMQLPAEVTALSVIDQKIYAALMAIAEEAFFRGFICNLFLIKFGEAGATFAGGAVGSIYHLARYGASTEAILFIFMAFSVLSFVSVRSGRISPAMTAHLVHNLLAA